MYQQFQNPNTTSTGVVIRDESPNSSSQYPGSTSQVGPIPVYRVTYVRNLGIVQLVFGVLAIVFGSIPIQDTPSFSFSQAGAGIWSGVIVVIAGSLCIASSCHPKRFGLRCSSIIFCIISTLLAFSVLWIGYVGYSTTLTCDIYSYDPDDPDDENWYNEDCTHSTTTSVSFILLGVVMTLEFVVSIIATVYTRQPCCCTGCCLCCYPCCCRRYPPGEVCWIGCCTFPCCKKTYPGRIIVPPNGYPDVQSTNNTGYPVAPSHSSQPTYNGPPSHSAQPTHNELPSHSTQSTHNGPPSYSAQSFHNAQPNPIKEEKLSEASKNATNVDNEQQPATAPPPPYQIAEK